jgi:hypothetical protein
MSKRLLLSLVACIVLFGAASYLPFITESLFAPAAMSEIDRFEVDQCSAGDVDKVPSDQDDVEATAQTPRLTAASTFTPRTQRDERSVTVYITDTGAKYHVGSCRYLSHSKHPISLKDAKAQGYEACKVCRPPR